MSDTTTTETTTLEATIDGGDVAAALAAAEPTSKTLVDYDIDSPLPLIVVRRGDHVIDQVNLERYAPRPHRPGGTVTVLTAEAFLTALQHRAHEADTVAVYGDPDSCQLVAVLNDDYDGRGGWRDHRIELTLKPTPEWTHWTRCAGIGNQERFATVIEEGEDEIVEPSAAVMLDIAQSFHASTGGKFKKTHRLAGGKTQLVWEEDTDAKAGESGEVKIPETFTLALRPFYGADPRPVTARLRWRISSGALQIGYELKRPDEVRREAFATDVLGAIEGGVPSDVPVIEGTPAGPVSPVRR